jgi:hypothetical protein
MRVARELNRQDVSP